MRVNNCFVMRGCSLINFEIKGDHNGSLVSVENNKNIPFDIKRVYYIFGTAVNVVRGKHAHKNLEQVVICVSGSCDFILDDGKEKKTIHLDNPSEGIYIKNNIWREFTNFTKDCVVVVLASQFYDENDYIRNYDEFLGINK